MGHVDVNLGQASASAADQFQPFEIANPFAFYKWARENEPVFYSDQIDYYVVTRHEDIKTIFSDWENFSAEIAQKPYRPICDEAKKIMADGGFTAYSGL
ncbi:MAG: cytochrome P450, partial [Pseudomonadota bacterium]